MKFRFNSHYNTIAAYVVLVFAFCLALVAVVFRFSALMAYVHRLFKVIAPITWGIVIAYLSTPLLTFFEKYLKKWINRKKEHNKLIRVISIFLCMSILILSIVGIVYAVIPEIISSMKNIFTLLPDYLSNLQQYLTNRFNSFIQDNPELGEKLTNCFTSLQDMLLGLADEYSPKLDSLLDKEGVVANVTSSAYAFLITLKDFCLGLFVSVYLLYSKELFLAQIKKVVHALFSKRHCELIFRIASRTNYTFMHFFSGKAVDSLIIGMLCFIILTIMKMPYVLLISILVGVTNMLPFFGPIIGAVPSGLLILVSEPDRTLAFVIFIILLQQFDGNILGPKILGNSLGLSPFWIMFAIFLGGGMFNFLGMVAFVPLFAVLYAFFRDSVNQRLSKKHLPVGSEAYMSPGMITRENPKPVPAEKPADTKKQTEDKPHDTTDSKGN